MTARRLIHSLLLSAIFFSFSFGQNIQASKLATLAKFGHFTNSNPALDHRNFFEAMAGEMGLSSPNEMVLEQTIAGKNGFVHYKFQQYHAGLPIVGSTYILHEKNGQVTNANGHFTPNINKAATPSISPGRAMQVARQKMNAREYAPEAVVPILCFIDPAFPKTSEDLKLAYELDLKSVEPFDKQRFYVDAERGNIITQFPLILQEGVPSTAVTKYYGTVNVITDSLGPQNFVLRDPTRGEGIFVYNSDLNSFTNNSSAWDLTNDDKDEVALDAHYCTTRFYDMMLENFDWNGQDGQGKAMKVTVHNNGAGNVNAFWDGEYSNYGDGDCIYGPLITLEVIGHEFTHGVVDYTSQLVYSNESGAMNESMADMMGKALEWYSDPGNFSWVLSHSFLLDPSAKPFRVMDDPKTVEMPAYYGGEFWFDGADVHTNSSIGNLWFSMLADGKQGENEAGYLFDVPGLGMEKASQIAFHTNKNYLTSSSDYNDFYHTSLLAAEELYGPGAAEIAAVDEAWKAVGLPTGPGGGPDFDLALPQGFSGFKQYCGLGQYIPLEIKITNKGTTPYLPSMNGVLVLSESSQSDYEYELNEVIHPGQVLTVTIDDWFLPISADYYYVNISLGLNDEVPDNNYSNEYIQLFENTANDLSLGSVTIHPPACFESEYIILYNITNNSCTPLPAGTTLKLLMEKENGTDIWTTDYTLQEDLEAFGFLSIPNFMPLSIDPTEEIRFYVDFDEDVSEEDNESFAFISSSVAITGDYLNEFDGDVQINSYLAVESNVAPNEVEFEGNTYFGSTGLFSDAGFFTHCPNFEDNFSGNGFFSPVVSTIRTCVDHSNFEQSILSFDLRTFRNNIATAEGYLYSSMLQAKWKGSQNGNEIIAGGPEGISEPVEIILPNHFKGELELKFYTEIGQFYLDPIYFDNDDVLLMDNLHLQAISTGTEEETAIGRVKISPNPTANLLNVRSGKILKSAQLIGLNGNVLQHFTLNSRSFEVDMSVFGNGLYFLRLETQDGQWLVEKVVKIE